MTDSLLGLEDPHNSRLAFEVAVFRDPDVRLLVFFLGLLELHLVDLDAEFRVVEAGVDGEGVCVVDLFAFGVLCERS